MYKTVRHGENSLQYTILPQTEEVLNNSGLKGKGRDYSPSIHVRRSQSKSTRNNLWIWIGVIVVILAIASLPYVIIGILKARRNYQDTHEIITNPPLTPTGREIVKSRKKELKMIPLVYTSVEPKLDLSTSTVSSTTTTSTTASTVTSERATTLPWTLNALRSWKSTTSSTTIPPIPTEDTEKIPLIGTPSGSIRLLDHNMSAKPWEDIIIRPTITAELTTFRDVVKYYTKTSKPADKSMIINQNQKVIQNVLITPKATTQQPVTTETISEGSKMGDLKETILSVDEDDIFDEVFSLPPLKPDSGTESDEVIVSKASDGGWYGARWPFVDTSSYFQWTGYSPGDNLLLPLLVAALTSIALVLLLALAVRRRKRSHIASLQIGKLTADLQADDNTNLLAAENPDDGEE